MCRFLVLHNVPFPKLPDHKIANVSQPSKLQMCIKNVHYKGTVIPATRDHISEDPKLKKYPILDPKVSFLLPSTAAFNGGQ